MCIRDSFSPVSFTDRPEDSPPPASSSVPTPAFVSINVGSSGQDGSNRNSFWNKTFRRCLHAAVQKDGRRTVEARRSAMASPRPALHRPSQLCSLPRVVSALGRTVANPTYAGVHARTRTAGELREQVVQPNHLPRMPSNTSLHSFRRSDGGTSEDGRSQSQARAASYHDGPCVRDCPRQRLSLIHI